MFAAPPDEVELAKRHLTLADLEDSIVEVWPDNVPAHNLMAVIQNQWRLSPAGGPYALDYAVLPAMWPLLGVAEADRYQVFRDLQVMEEGALKQMKKR